jgi:hypothetical protein
MNIYTTFEMIVYREVESSKQLAGCLPLTNRLRNTAARKIFESES